MNTQQELVVQIGSSLTQRGLLLVITESCTGGWVAQTLTSVAGSSAWFERGFVTYSNLSKQQMLGVSPETLAAYGAVSEPVAREMVTGAVANSAAQVGVAVTGIAGPGGGTVTKPVGTVCFAWAREGLAKEDWLLQVTTEHFAGDRQAVRQQAVVRALQGIGEILTDS